MLEHSVYSVISPEGCASILWRSAERREEAATAQKLTAQHLKTFGVIDAIIQEPLGGAHRNRTATIDSVGDALEKALSKLILEKECCKKRRDKFLAMGRLALA
jgi:acetyl-CoA carboxylase carboxyl transferase subunit alpha